MEDQAVVCHSDAVRLEYSDPVLVKQAGVVREVGNVDQIVFGQDLFLQKFALNIEDGICAHMSGLAVVSRQAMGAVQDRDIGFFPCSHSQVASGNHPVSLP